VYVVAFYPARRHATNSAAVMTKCGCTGVSPVLEEFDANPDPFGDGFDPGA
jgi:hypothetical protein